MFGEQEHQADKFEINDLSSQSFEKGLDAFPPLVDLDMLDNSFLKMDPNPVFESYLTIKSEDVDFFQKDFDQDYGLDNILEEIEKPRIFRCPFCGKQFLKSTALGGHTSKMHPREKQEQRQREALERQQKRAYEESLGIGKRKKICKLSKESTFNTPIMRRKASDPNRFEASFCSETKI